MNLVGSFNKLIEKITSDNRFKNAIWMVIEKGISLIGLIFVISAMAKYMGPRTYGYIALSTSIFVIIKSISQMGLDQIYFKHISKGRTKNNFFMQNAIILVSIIYGLFSIIICIFYFYKIPEIEFILFLSVCISLFFLSIDIRTVHLDAILRSKFNVIANIFGLLLSLILRHVIIVCKLPVVFFSIPIMFLTIFPFFIRWIFFEKNNFLIKKKNNLIIFKKYSKYIYRCGVPLTLSVLSVNIYLQSANIMLANFYGVESVGIYAIAVMLAGSWYFLPTTFILSFLPKIYETKSDYDYLKESSFVLRWLVLVTFFIVVFLFLISDYVVEFLYGPDYISSVPVFKILLFSNFFSILGFYFYRLIIKSSGYNFLAKKMFITCIFNLILTFFMVKEYGLIGAAISSLITEIVSNIFFNLFYKKLKLLSLIKISILGR